MHYPAPYLKPNHPTNPLTLILTLTKFQPQTLKPSLDLQTGLLSCEDQLKCPIQNILTFLEE